jgi:glutamate racemase
MRYLILLFFIWSGIFLSSCKDIVSEQPLLPISQKALNDTSSVFYAGFSSYPDDKKLLSIGVFDSDVMGLYVMEKLLSLDKYDNITGKRESDGIADFAGENFIYFADQANMPYDRYCDMKRGDYLKELVIKDVLFLMGESYFNLAIDDKPFGLKERVKIILSADNTATAYCMEDINALIKASGTGVKVVSIINSGVTALFSELDKSNNYSVGLMASPETVSSGAYEKIINDVAVKASFTGKVQLYNQSCAGFAEAVDGVSFYVQEESVTSPIDGYLGPHIGEEEGDIDISILNRYNFDFSNNGIIYTKNNGEYSDIQLNSPSNYARFYLVSLLEKHRKSGSRVPLRSVILGCNHYSFLSDTLNKVIEELRNFRQDGIYIYRNTISKDFKFIDPALYAAMDCYEILRKDNELALNPQKGFLRSFISVPSYGLPIKCISAYGTLNDDYKYGRDTGTETVSTKQVPFSSRYINKKTQDKIEKLLPYSFALIREHL